MFSAFFIKRPILTIVFAIIVMIAGISALRILPVEQFPQITPPTVTVQANYPGVSADILQTAVADPLEHQINGMENMIYMISNSSNNGTVNITVYFNVGTDPEQALINVNNRVQLALPDLPEEVRRQGISVQKRSGTILQIVALYSPDGRYDATYISNYALLNVLDEIKRLPGAGDSSIFGARDYSMRIWLRPDEMAKLGVTPGDIGQALATQNANYATGAIGAEPALPGTEMTYLINSKGRFSSPDEFENIIVRANTDGSAIARLKDVSRVELGSRDYSFQGRFSGKSAVLIGVFLQSGSNALDLSRRVNETMKKLSERFPPGITYTLARDNTEYVRASIHEVMKTLLEVAFLVVIVIYLFLQNWRATIIPMVAVPISLIGTFVGLLAFGYTVNTLTLFALVLAIGIVVDDAIVVLENTERILATRKIAPREAAIAAMEEVSSPVIAIVFVLCAVFVPVAFVGGVAGVLYKQFAVTVAISVVLSGLIALTLSPALCALLLKTEERKNKFRFFTWFEGFFQRTTGKYSHGVQAMLHHPWRGVIAFVAMSAAAVFLFLRLPASFVPEEDQGYFTSLVMLTDASALSRTAKASQDVERILAKIPEVDGYTVFNGFDILNGAYKTSAATIFVTLKPWDRRTRTAQEILGEYRQKTAALPNAMVLAFNPPAILGLGSSGGFEYYLQNRGTGDMGALEATGQLLLKEAARRPELANVATQFRARIPQLLFDVNREKAQSLGVPLQDIFFAMQANFGTFYVNDFNRAGRTFRVQIQAEPQYRARLEDIGRVFVRSAQGAMIPISALAQLTPYAASESITRFNGFPSMRIIGSAAPGRSSGDALVAMDELSRNLPSDYSYAWGGQSYQEKESQGSGPVAFGLAIVIVFLILAALYENWSLPLSVLLIVPFGLFGAALAVSVLRLTNDIYFQIGLITLIGLSAKNAILIVEFAAVRFHNGMPIEQAAIEAARLRFRPILMTSLAFILGVVPLIFSTGAGAASRHSIGAGVFGGMLAATFLAVFFVPLFFTIIESFSARLRGRHEHHEQPMHNPGGPST